MATEHRIDPVTGDGEMLPPRECDCTDLEHYGVPVYGDESINPDRFTIRIRRGDGPFVDVSLTDALAEIGAALTLGEEFESGNYIYRLADGVERKSGDLGDAEDMQPPARLDEMAQS